MPDTEIEIDPYELVGVASEATEAEIRKAYRQRSLKVHPDRNPNLPDAARKFHELTQAYELLLDPLRRMAVDAKIRLKEARKQRYAAYDNKRKTMVEELEQRERAFKKTRMEKEKEEMARWQENEKIMDEGRKLREEREKETLRKESEREKAETAAEEAETDAPPDLGDWDTTIKLKFLLSSRPDLSAPDVLAKLLSPFGPIDASSIVISKKPPKKAPHKPPKFATALVPFKQIGDAFAAVSASGREERGLKDVEIGWAEGKEPAILGWLKKQGKLGGVSLTRPQPTPTPVSSSPGVAASAQTATKPQLRPAANPSSSFSSFPETFPTTSTTSQQSAKAPSLPGLDFESLTLLRMRQAERERLEREIREQEENE
ncbi:hypothetical protein JAAARDRAFT_57434 [Jaapia argillacea MUCL 33604]|uniref:J domain-containing protein n=1 Tax=Jaapia argillacea MUCL 33604 TaxID=933084 RepID=A0A067PXA9_9AGAM|nr:hypothetical protein JAAARDRAFT_57434 [Jaapia argillacea MUCL 33604]